MTTMTPEQVLAEWKQPDSHITSIELADALRQALEDRDDCRDIGAEFQKERDELCFEQSENIRQGLTGKMGLAVENTNLLAKLKIAMETLEEIAHPEREAKEALSKIKEIRMSTFEKLTKHNVDLCISHIGYKLDDIQKHYSRVKIYKTESILAINVDGCIVDFAFFQFLCSDDEGGDLYENLWQGTGVGEGLREMRHIWFGGDDNKDGYINYLYIDEMIDAMTVLKEYFT